MLEGCCAYFFHPIKKEFQWSNFGLKHEPAEDFLKSQWQKQNKSYWWLLYRWLLAACFTAGVIGSMVEQFEKGKWFIYLTDWGFALCMLTSVSGAILVSIYYCNPNKFANCSCYLKFYWALHWSTLVVAAVITFVYWIFIFPYDDANATALYNLWSHAFNTILMMLDHFLVAFPTRLMHFIYPIIVCLVYILFTVIYHLAGGLNIFGYPYIYEILDWSQPGWALLTVFGVMVLLLIFCFIFFGLYKLRTNIYKNCNKTQMAFQA